MRSQPTLRSAALLCVVATLGCTGSDAMFTGDGSPAWDAGEVAPCDTDLDCSDGVYCNGYERCVYDGGARARCVGGDAIVCDDGIECTVDRCSHAMNTCLFEPVDADGDGHADVACLGPDGFALGDDCDDDDPDRYPGNPERCDLESPDHDEDCDAESFGVLDMDGDGVVSDLCCALSDGEARCGSDCDDNDPDRYPEHPEICDEKDNDCDGETDVGTREVAWYPDADGDDYGASDADAVMSCAPLAGHALRATDCDDTRPFVHPAAREVCDGFDNDCDGSTDGGGVCQCAPAGGQQPCGCDATVTGTQICDNGNWSECDCSECIEGVSECLGDLIPRQCVDGRWAVRGACTGARPICLSGQCVCADGTLNCDEVVDVVAPVVVASAPAPSSNAPIGSIIAAVFSEAISGASVQGQFVLRDAYGDRVPGTVAVGGRTVTFTPDAPLRAGTPYLATLGGSITDLAGNGLGSDYELGFMTAVGPSAVTMRPPAGIRYQDPNLAINATGEAFLVLNERVSSDPVAERTVIRARSAGTWSEPTVLRGNMHAGAAAAIDGAGEGFLWLRQGGTLSAFDYSKDTGWVAGAGSVPAASPLAVVAAMNGAGFGVALGYEGAQGGKHLVQSRNPGGVLTGGVFETDAAPGALKDRALAIGSAGHGACAWIEAGAVEVYRSDAGLGAWTRAAGIPRLISDLLEVDVAVDGQGVAVLLHTEVTTPGAGTVIKTAVRQLGSNATWLGTKVSIAGTDPLQPDSMPAVGIDGADRALGVFVSGGHRVHATRELGGGEWEAAAGLNPPDSDTVHELELTVAGGGQAVAVWAQDAWAGGNERDLWAARYTPAKGWQRGGRIYSGGQNLAGLSIATDSAGNVTAVFDDGDVVVIELPADTN